MHNLTLYCYLYNSKIIQKWPKNGDILVTKFALPVAKKNSALTGSIEGLHTVASTLTICLGNV
jgi:hypothetical protein